MSTGADNTNVFRPPVGGSTCAAAHRSLAGGTLSALGPSGAAGALAGASCSATRAAWLPVSGAFTEGAAAFAVPAVGDATMAYATTNDTTMAPMVVGIRLSRSLVAAEPTTVAMSVKRFMSLAPLLMIDADNWIGA